MGPQFTAIKAQLGPVLNNALGYELYVPAKTMNFPGIQEFIARYQKVGNGTGRRPARFLRASVHLFGNGGSWPGG